MFALSRRFVFFALLAITLVVPRDSWAAFSFCNKTADALEVSFGYREDAGWLSEGWWQLPPEKCVTTYAKPLVQRFYFYYARTLEEANKKKKPAIWQGKYSFCVDTKPFRIEGDGACTDRGFREEGFREIDVGVGKKDYTLTFKAPQ